VSVPMLSRHMRQQKHHDENRELVPMKGDRIELVRSRAGVHTRGTVYHVDQVQILVKWDDGRSEALRPGVDRFKIVEPE
jgi:Domain of unknown function (DUF4314)